MLTLQNQNQGEEKEKEKEKKKLILEFEKKKMRVAWDELREALFENKSKNWKGQEECA